MLRTIAATILAAGLAAATLPTAIQDAAAQATEQKQAKPKKAKPLTPGQQAARERQKKCGAEWKAAKAAGKIDKGMKWPRFWSACNARLKAGA